MSFRIRGLRLTSARVLLLSRRAAFLEPLTQAFEKAGIDVKQVGDGDEAASVFLDESAPVPAGAVIDLLTIDDDATDLCTRVRERKDAESVPILFIGTGQESIRSTTDALIAGGDGFFQLPVEAPRVVAKVAAYLGIPLPVLPHGLLVTIDDHDLLERTPEPTRLVVPAALPEDLLGEDPHADTPPEGTPSLPDDFGDTTTPFHMPRGDTLTGLPSLVRGPTSLEGDDADALLEEHARHEADEAARLAREAAAAAVEDTVVAAADDAADAEAEAVAHARLLAQEEEQARADKAKREREQAERDREEWEKNEKERVERERAQAVFEAEQAALAAAAAAEDAARAERERQAQEELAALERAAADEARRRAEAQQAEEQAAQEKAEQEKKAREKAFAAAEAERIAALQKLEDERVEAEVRAQTLAEMRAEEEARVKALQEEARRAEEELRQQQEAKRKLLEEEERRLQRVLEERQRAEAEALEADARKEEELKAEEQRLRDLEEKRLRLEEEAALFQDAQEQQRLEEEQRLAELQERRRQIEEDAARVAAEAAQKKLEQVAELEIIARRRADEEEALKLLEQSQKEKQEREEQQLAELALRRRRLEEAELEAEGARQRRIADEELRLQKLAEERERLQREQQEQEALADEERKKRLAAEEARLEELQKERERAWAEAQLRDALAEEERQRRLHEEEERIAALAAERERLAADQEAARARLLAQEEEERARIAALEIQRQRAEEELAKARADVAARVDEEEARLRALRDEHAQKEREARAALDEQRRLAREEQERLEALSREKKQLEQKTAEQAKKAADDEMLARARLAEIEIARLRAEEEAEQERLSQQKRAEEAAVAVAAVEEERKKAEAQAAARAQALRDASLAEEERLQALLQERERRESELKKLEQTALSHLATEERRLRELVERGEAERAAAARDAVRLENEIKVRAAEAEQKLASLSAEHERLAGEAAREAERLALLRAEEEAARKELEENRSRQKLAFVSGRFDAVLDRASGVVVAGADVGSDARNAAEFEGRVFGAHGFARVDPDDQAPPPPLPFVALEPQQGRFDDGELPALLLSAHALKVTGAVEIVNDDGRARTLFLEEGEPVFVASAIAADRAEEVLLRGGFITAARHAELRAGPMMSARRMCARLVDDNLLKIDELFSAVRGVLTEQVLALFEWPTGTFTFKEERAFAADRVRLGHPFAAIVAEGVRRKYDEPRLWSVLGGPQTLLGPQVASTSMAVALPPLSPEETLALARFDGTRALDDVILESGLHPHTVLRAALIGVTTGAVKVLARGLPRGPFETLARRERAVAIDRARVIDRLQLARHGDYFTFLGVAPDATAFEVHRAAQKLRERFDPQRYKDSAFADLVSAVQEIVDVAGDAEAVLADDGLKEAYKKNLRQAAPSSSSSSSSKNKQAG